MSRLPSVRRHSKGYFFIRLNGKDHYLGKDKSKANVQAKLLLSDYLRDQHVSSFLPRITPSELTIEEIVVEYLLYSKTYYTGSERSEESFNRCRRSLQPLIDLYGQKSAERVWSAVSETGPSTFHRRGSFLFDDQ